MIMEFNWDDFKSKYSNEQEARQGFAQLCETIMQLHYPDFIVKNSDTIDEDKKTEDKTLDRKCIIFLPKYFLDGVSNSRKGQIRKALNDNLPYMKANKIEQWFLLMPLKFSPEENNWWENWSLRIKQENAITPTAILSDQIIDLVAKHGIEFRGLEKVAEQVVSATETVDFVFEDEAAEHAVEVPVETVPAAGSVTITKTTTTVTTTETKVVPESKSDDEPSAKSEPVAELETKPKTETVTKTTKTVFLTAPTPKPAEAAESSKKDDAGKDAATVQRVKEPNLNQLRMTYRFKQQFEELEAQKLALPKDGPRNGQRGIFDRRRDLSNVKNYLNDFVFGDLSNFKGKELVKKAQIYVTNEQYSRGLYIYEYAYAKKLVEKDLMADYNKGVAEADFKLQYKYQMILGDLLFAKGDYINAHDAYEKAINIKTSFMSKLEEKMSYSIESDTFSPSIRDNEAETKLLEAKAEALLHINEYDEAVDNFKLAVELDPDNRELEGRYELAQKLQTWSRWYNNKWFGWLSPLWAPIHYYFFVRKNNGIQDLKITKTIKRRAWIGIILWAIIIGLALTLWFMRDRLFLGGGSDDNGVRTTAQAPSTPLELNISKGDYYMSMVSDDKPHYIDSAIYAYHRAIRFDNTDTIAKPLYNRAMIRKNDMVTQMQRNITNDSATYFLSMRRPTEGLRLFKYKYDPRNPEKGKFGFVDTLGNIVIPPFYDFNYKTMDEQGETFFNGKAKVCLEVAPYDTVYFYIDQRGNKIDE